MRERVGIGSTALNDAMSKPGTSVSMEWHGWLPGLSLLEMEVKERGGQGWKWEGAWQAQVSAANGGWSCHMAVLVNRLAARMLQDHHHKYGP